MGTLPLPSLPGPLAVLYLDHLCSLLQVRARDGRPRAARNRGREPGAGRDHTQIFGTARPVALLPSGIVRDLRHQSARSHWTALRGRAEGSSGRWGIKGPRFSSIHHQPLPLRLSSATAASNPLVVVACARGRTPRPLLVCCRHEPARGRLSRFVLVSHLLKLSPSLVAAYGCCLRSARPTPLVLAASALMIGTYFVTRCHSRRGHSRRLLGARDLRTHTATRSVHRPVRCEG